MSKCPSIECFDPPGTTLDPNPDIGGPGVSRDLDKRDSECQAEDYQVIIGFLGTAWFVVLVVIVHYFLSSQIITEDPFASPDPDGVWSPNRIDQLVLRIPQLPRWLYTIVFGGLHDPKPSSWLAERPRWEHAFTKVVIIQPS